MIEALHMERNRLLRRISLISDIINLYEPKILPKREYPKTETWEEKIMHTLSEIDKPCYVKDVVAAIALYEELEISKLHKTVTMYLWSLAKRGKIKSQRMGYRNKYSLIVNNM